MIPCNDERLPAVSGGAQGDDGPEAPRPAAVCAVGEEVLVVAGGESARLVDVLRQDAGLLELQAIGRPEAQVRAALFVGMREELGFMARERFLELPLDLRADLVAARADGRPDGGEQLLRPRAELLPHAQDGLGGDAAHRALPAAVRNAHRTVDRVE